MTTAVKDSYIATHACGCITAWISDRADNHTAKFLSDHVKDGQAVEHVTLDDVRNDPLFFPKECPHDPMGWEPWKPEPYKPKASWKNVRSGGIKRVYVTTPWHRSCSWFEVKKDEGKWWACEGWFDAAGHVAHRGDEQIEVHGPFATQKEAGEFVVPASMEVSRRKWLGYGDRTEEQADEMLAFAEGRV